jgi:hypothetical protein
VILRECSLKEIVMEVRAGRLTQQGFEGDQGFLYEAGGDQALQELDKTRPNLRNRIGKEVEAAVCRRAVDQPASRPDACRHRVEEGDPGVPRGRQECVAAP